MKHTATILRILPSFQKIGPVQGTLSTVSYMDATQYQTLVAALGDSGWGLHAKDAPSLRDDFDAASIPTFSLKLRKPWDLFIGVPRLLDLIETENPDIVHTQLLRPDVYGRIAAHFKKKIVVSTLHSENQWLVERGIVSRLTAYFDRKTAQLVDGFIAVAPAVKDFAVTHLHIPPEKITVISNGVDLKRFSPVAPSARDALRASLGINADQKVIGTVGRLVPQKNPRMFFDAAKKIYETEKSARFFWVGEGPLLSEMQQYTKELGISEVCTFLGVRNDVPHLLAAFDIFLLTSDYEGLSNALLEAMAAHVPCVATDVSGTHTVVTHGVTGFLVPAKDVSALVAATSTLLHDADLRSKLATAAFEILIKNYTSERVAREHEAFYEALLAAKKDA